MHIVYKEETYKANIILRDFRIKSDWIKFFFRFCMRYCVLTSALWRLSKLKIMISHIMTNDWLDFHVVKQLWKYIQLLFWKSMSNFVLRFFLRSVYIGGNSAGAGSSLVWVICERGHVLLVGKNCSKNSNCKADSVYVVWDSCCITVLHTHTHGNERFSLN